MSSSIDFFRDEVRDGFYIPTAIKQAWAATLDVLSEIDRICTKHNIKYFADWGTLLGTVRHGGFVPWDDDLDICMIRDDYIRFRQVVDDELRSGMVIHDYERKDDHWLFLARVVNNDKMCFEEKYLEEHNNFPYLAGVDIFLKDYLYMDDEREIERDKDIMTLVALTEGIVEGELHRESIKAKLDEINNKHNVNISIDEDSNTIGIKLYNLAERLMSQVKGEETDRIGQIFPMVLKSGISAAEPKDRYNDIIRLPFENTTIPVPAAYNSMLIARYGNYCIPHKVWSGHDYPFFEGQIADIESVIGEKLPAFTFDKSMLDRPNVDYSNSLKETVGDCMTELKRQVDVLDEMLSGLFWQDLADTANTIQGLAVDMANLIEQVKGDYRDSVHHIIDAVQLFVDSLYEEFQSANQGIIHSFDKTKETFLLLDEAINKYIIDRREVLFVTIGPKEWSSYESIYNSYDGDDADIFVVPLPLMKKGYLGKITMTAQEIQDSIHLNDYPTDIFYTDWGAYDISLHCPDEVYVQFAYDGENPTLAIPTNYYVANMLRYAAKIIYIPIAKTDEISDNDTNDLYNMKHYVTKPAVIYADETRVQSDNIRQRYIDALIEFAGEDTIDIWRDKIVMSDNDKTFDAKSTDKSTKKKMIYCIGVNELVEHTDCVTDAIAHRLNIMADNLDNIDVAVTYFPDDTDTWRSVRQELSGSIFDIVDRYINDNRMSYVSTAEVAGDDIAGQYDAYYGSPSPLATCFLRAKKPVMLSDYDIDVN